MSLQVTEKVTLLPAVSASQHGQEVHHTARSVFDSLGRLQWQKSPRGFITFSLYDVVTGVLQHRIEDVDVAKYNATLGGGAVSTGAAGLDHAGQWRCPHGNDL
jgi:hypothetical protein